MTVAALSSSIEYLEDGVSLAFPLPFRFLAGTITASRVLADGTVVTLTYGTHFSTSGGETDAGGTLTLVSTVAGATLRIRRATPRAQTTDYPTTDVFPSASHELALDRSILIDQEQDDKIADTAQRALMVPDGETAAGLPDAAARSGKFLVGLPGGGFAFSQGTGADLGLREALGSAADGEGDALVAFKQAGIGAAVGSVDIELSRWVVVDQFTGCDKTGATASTTAFRNAAAAAGTGCVIVPPGSYLLDNSVSYPCTFWFMPGASIINGTGGYITGAIVDLADRDYEALMGMGSFNVWLEGTSFSSPANNSFVASLWRAQYDGTAGTFSVDQAGGPLSVGAFNGIRWNQTVAGSGSTYRQLEYRIEDATTYNNGKATLSFIASCEAGTVNVSASVRQFFGSGGSPSADVVVATKTFTVTTTPQRFDLTVDMPSTASKTFGSNFDDCLKLSIGFPATGVFNVALQQVRFERGAIRSVFQATPLALQYTHIDRYLQFVPLSIVGRAVGAGEQTHTPIPFKSEMRRAPTITVDGAALSGAVTNVTGGVQTNYAQRYGAMAFIQSTGAGVYSATGQLIKMDARI